MDQASVRSAPSLLLLESPCPTWASLDTDQGGESAIVSLHPYHPWFCLIKFAKGVSLTLSKLEVCSYLLTPFNHELQSLMPSSYNQKNDRFSAGTTASYSDSNDEVCYQALAHPKTFSIHQSTKNRIYKTWRYQTISGPPFSYIVSCMSHWLISVDEGKKYYQLPTYCILGCSNSSSPHLNKALEKQNLCTSLLKPDSTILV